MLQLRCSSYAFVPYHIGGPLALEALIAYIQRVPQPFSAAIEERILKLNRPRRLAQRRVTNVISSMRSMLARKLSERAVEGSAP